MIIPHFRNSDTSITVRHRVTVMKYRVKIKFISQPCEAIVYNANDASTNEYFIVMSVADKSYHPCTFTL